MKVCFSDGLSIPAGACYQPASANGMNVQRTAMAAFRTTHWTRVLEAAHSNADTDGSAFAELYLAYWYPLYAHARRRGLSPTEGEDVIQDFFSHLIHQQSFARLQREGGKFRSFLLSALENFLSGRRRKESALKRGGGQSPLSLNAEEVESRFALEAPDNETPESAFEKRWALALIEHATDRLRKDYAEADKSEFFTRIENYLQPDHSGPSYATTAAQCGMSEGAFKVAVHRMRQRYGELLREAVARTVGSSAEVDEELRYLIGVVAR